ncbi:MAG: twin-arginine translocase TatA/TatE family subunit [Acidobacteriaceae bacterium]
MFDRILEPQHLIIILIICLLIFGPTKLPGLGKGLGTAFREFKEGIKGGGSTDNAAAPKAEDTTAKSETPTTPTAQVK